MHTVPVGLVLYVIPHHLNGFHYPSIRASGNKVLPDALIQETLLIPLLIQEVVQSRPNCSYEAIPAHSQTSYL